LRCCFDLYNLVDKKLLIHVYRIKGVRTYWLGDHGKLPSESIDGEIPPIDSKNLKKGGFALHKRKTFPYFH